MLTIDVPDGEFLNNETQEIFVIKGQRLQLEHSLVSLTKWESKWKKPFLVDNNKTREEILDYIRCMTITQNVNPLVYRCLSEKNILDIKRYIDDTMTATTITESLNKKKKKPEIYTSELLYYYMFSFGIPIECQKWHLNRLFTLIKVFSVKNSDPEKVDKKEYLEHRRALNKSRRAAKAKRRNK